MQLYIMFNVFLFPRALIKIFLLFASVPLSSLNKNIMGGSPLQSNWTFSAKIKHATTTQIKQAHLSDYIIVSLKKWLK